VHADGQGKLATSLWDEAERAIAAATSDVTEALQRLNVHTGVVCS